MRSLLLLTLLAGCAHVREARAIHPNPALALQSTEVLPVSARLDIFQRDVHLGDSDYYRDYQLRSSAQFTVVSKERLRFHVTVTRWDEDEAELSNWTAWMEDDTGKRYELTTREGGKMHRIAIGWRLYHAALGDTYCPQPPCMTKIIPGFDVYESEADLVFRYPNILKDRKGVTLVLHQTGLTYRFVWTFGEGWIVQNYGRTKVDEEMGTIIVPGPNTQVAGTRYEGEHW
jgi:hypothetical protein